MPVNKTVEIYYIVNEFFKEYDAVIKSHSLEEGSQRNGGIANSPCPE